MSFFKVEKSSNKCHFNAMKIVNSQQLVFLSSSSTAKSDKKTIFNTFIVFIFSKKHAFFFIKSNYTYNLLFNQKCFIQSTAKFLIL